MKNRTSDEINDCNHFEPGNIGKQNKINNEDSNGNKKPKNNKKELIFLARKTKRSNTLKNYDYPFNILMKVQSYITIIQIIFAIIVFLNSQIYFKDR